MGLNSRFYLPQLNITFRYVEDKYRLYLGAAQNTHLARAIATGTENNIFVLPKVEFPVLFSMHMQKLMLINYQQAPLVCFVGYLSILRIVH